MLAGTRAAALEALADELGERAHVAAGRSRRPGRARPPGQARPRRRWAGSTSSSTMPGSPATALALRMKRRGLAGGPRCQPDRRVPADARRVARHGAAPPRAGRSRSPRWSGSPAMPGRRITPRRRPAMIGMSKSTRRRGREPRHHRQLRRAGLIATAMTDKLSDEQRARIADAIPDGPLRRSGRHRGRRRLPRERRGGLRHRPDLHINGGMAMV